jgi:hypothetical protein
MGKKQVKKKKPLKRKHSTVCPCGEHIKTQTSYYSKLLPQLGCGNLKKRADILKKCDPCFIRYLGKCASGVLHSVIKLPHKSYQSLSDSKKLLIHLSNPKTSVERKRKQLLGQVGSGFFPIIAGLASTLLGNLFGKVFTS